MFYNLKKYSKVAYLVLLLRLFIGYLSFRILKIAVDIKSVKVVGWLLLLFSTKIFKSNHNLYGSIIVLNKLGFTEEILTMIETHKPNLPNIIFVPRKYTQIISGHFLSRELRHDYLEKNKIDQYNFDRAAFFWSEILIYLSNKINLKLVLSGNFVYWAERPIASASNLTNVKFCVLQKETFMTKRGEKSYVDLLKNTQPFYGHKLFVFSQLARERLLKSNVANASTVQIVGSLRLQSSKITQFQKPKQESDTVVFFVPSVAILNEKFIKEYQQTLIYTQELITLGLRFIQQASLHFPFLKFIIKEKNQARSDTVANFFSSSVHIPKNMILLPPASNLAESVLDFAVGSFGFNTTALFDSVMHGVPTANFRGNVSDDADWEYYFENYGDSLPQITTYSTFLDWINAILIQDTKSKWLDLEFEALRNYFIYNFGNYDENNLYKNIIKICK